MPTNPLLSLARRGWLVPMLELGWLGSSAYRVAFHGAGLESGLLHALDRQPSTAAELAIRLDLRADMTDGLASWLDAGVACGDLSRDDQGRYAIRRRSLRRLLKPSNDPVAAFTQEMATLHHRLLLETPRRLASGERFGVAEADPAVIARSSRMSEPWIAAALERFVPTGQPVRLLEVGCGSGAHIRTAARLNPQLTAVGLELQEPAAQIARRNISDWGLSDRVEIAVGDIRDREPDAAADLVTLHLLLPRMGAGAALRAPRGLPRAGRDAAGHDGGAHRQAVVGDAGPVGCDDRGLLAAARPRRAGRAHARGRAARRASREAGFRRAVLRLRRDAVT